MWSTKDVDCGEFVPLNIIVFNLTEIAVLFCFIVYQKILHILSLHIISPVRRREHIQLVYFTVYIYNDSLVETFIQSKGFWEWNQDSHCLHYQLRNELLQIKKEYNIWNLFLDIALKLCFCIHQNATEAGKNKAPPLFLL